MIASMSESKDILGEVFNIGTGQTTLCGIW